MKVGARSDVKSLSAKTVIPATLHLMRGRRESLLKQRKIPDRSPAELGQEPG
jgi:hypothetical protein